MKTSAFVPIVAYLGLAGLSSAAPLPGSESEVALDKRTFCFFGFGFGCNSNTPATTSSAAAKSTAASSAVTSSAAKSSAVTTSSAVKSSAAVSSAAATKASSVAPVASSAKAAVSSANAAVTKTGSAAWAQCTDFDWSSWDDKKVSWGGFNKQYVQDWYLAEYGLAPPPGMNWRQVSSLVNKFAVQTPATGPKTTSKATKGCSNPWTSAAPATKTKAVTITTAKPVTPSTTPVKPVTTSAAAQSSAAGNKSSANGVASSSPSSVKPIVSSAAASPSSAAAGKPSASSAAGPASSAAAPASSAVVPPVVVAPAQSSAAAPAQSSAAAAGPASPSPAPSSASPSPAAPSPSADGSSGSSGVGSGLPGTGAGLPGSGTGDNNGTATVVPEPEATEVAPLTINGYTYGGCAQEVAGRLLDKVQTQSSSQTIESCTALCSSYGFAVSGLEYGSECYCGTLEDIEDAELSGECKMPCSGNADQICGGPNAINWYYDADKIAPTVELPAGWTTYGVVSEGTHGARLMSTLLYASNDNTIEKCAAGCAAAGYKVAGTEYSSECFCSNGFLASSGGGQLLDDSAAFMKCSGNIAQSCGGPSILSVTSAFGDNIPFI